MCKCRQYVGYCRYISAISIVDYVVCFCSFFYMLKKPVATSYLHVLRIF